MSNTYTCASCKGIFEKAWSDEEAIAEKDRDFPTADMADCVVICDDCYKEAKKREAAYDSLIEDAQERLRSVATREWKSLEERLAFIEQCERREEVMRILRKIFMQAYNR